ncbi:MAG: hypothetical protein ACPHVU_02730, partial [Flavobacteriaceae bacterium]
MRAAKWAGVFLLISMALIVACESVQQPKPKAQLRLQYPQPNYKQLPDTYRFDFEYNNWVQLKRIAKTAPDLYYPKMKATLYLSYIGVENNIDSLVLFSDNLVKVIPC